MDRSPRKTGTSAQADTEVAVILVGGGGHAHVVLAAINNSHVVGLLDPALPVGTMIEEATVLGDDEVLQARTEPTHVAIGNNRRRREVVERIGPRQWRTIVSPHAIVVGQAEIGQGSFVGARAVIQPNVRIGRHVIINSGAIVEHDCAVGDFVHIAPAAVVCGGVSIGDDVFVGAGAIILPNVTVGPGATIGAGAVVLHDVPEGVTVVGNPAKPLERL